jgi:YD repeat-containing protein
LKVSEDPGVYNFLTPNGYDPQDDLVCVNQGSLGAGNACDVTQPHARSFHYDSLKRLLSATNPESGTIAYAYDPVGNLLSKTDSAKAGVNRVTCFGTYAGACDNKGYDALNRPIRKSYSDGTPAVSYLYDTAPGGVGPAEFGDRARGLGHELHGVRRLGADYGIEPGPPESAAGSDIQFRVRLQSGGRVDQRDVSVWADGGDRL